MFITRRVLIAAVALGLTAVAAGAEPKFGFGKAASDREIAAADIDIRYDGMGLPDGQGSTEQGATLYASQCAACHGAKLEGNSELYIKPLLGDARHSITQRPFAPPLFAYVRRAMPLTAPGSLSDNEVYALVAFLLKEAGVLESDDFVLDAPRLKAIDMPNRANFVPAADSGVVLPDK